MTAGLMQQRPLMIADILHHGVEAHGQREIVSKLVDEPTWRYNFAGLAQRAAQAAHMLGRLGVGPGGCVTSLAWNTHRHLELFYAVPGIGAFLHTANPRLSDEQLVYTINHAASNVLLYDRSFTALIERLRPRLEHIRHFIVLSQAEDGISPAYEALIAQESCDLDWPSFDENTASFLCYTSGTTGNPKGVLYSHRSVVLHAVGCGLASALALSAFDVVMPCQSLYHATAWGTPFAALVNGCKIVLPCDKFDGASLQALIKDEGVTFSGGVPTIWTAYLAHLEETGDTAANLDRLVIGGSAVPRAMAETFEQRYGVKIRQIWGMTETSPLGVLSTPTPAIAELGPEATNDILWSRQGRRQWGAEIRIVDEDGNRLAEDGAISGSLQIRGPWIVRRYFKTDHDCVDEDGWFDTGDIATIDSTGFMRITDRAKDVIKSGGEWISSIDIENVASACPGVKIAAVVGAYHPKWEERPVLIIELHDETELSGQEVIDFIAPHFARWWLPETVVFDAIPLTATGKIDKKLLRERYGEIYAKDGHSHPVDAE